MSASHKTKAAIISLSTAASRRRQCNVGAITSSTSTGRVVSTATATNTLQLPKYYSTTATATNTKSSKSANLTKLSSSRNNKNSRTFKKQTNSSSTAPTTTGAKKSPPQQLSQIDNSPTAVFSLFSKDPSQFRAKPFVDALEIASKKGSYSPVEASRVISLASREMLMWRYREQVLGVVKNATAEGNDASKLNTEKLSEAEKEQYQILLSMTGTVEPKKDASALVRAWYLLSQAREAKDPQQQEEQILKLFQETFSKDIHYENQSLYQWMQLLSLVNGSASVEKLHALSETLRSQLKEAFANKDFTNAVTRKTYYNQLQKISQSEFDALYEQCIKALQQDTSKPGEAPFTPRTNAAFDAWYKFTTERYFFKSLRYNKTKSLRDAQIANGNPDDGVQEYFKDLVPSSHVFTKSIILLAKYQHWEEAAYLYQEAYQRPIGMRAVVSYAKEFYAIRPHLLRYIRLGHVNPLQFNLGNLFSHAPKHRTKLFGELYSLMQHKGATDPNTVLQKIDTL